MNEGFMLNDSITRVHFRSMPAGEFTLSNGFEELKKQIEKVDEFKAYLYDFSKETLGQLKDLIDSYKDKLNRKIHLTFGK